MDRATETAPLLASPRPPRSEAEGERASDRATETREAGGRAGRRKLAPGGAGRGPGPGGGRGGGKEVCGPEDEGWVGGGGDL